MYLMIETWNVVWVDTRTAIGPSAAIYFVIVTFLANYIILNLVVATLISTFERVPPIPDARTTVAGVHVRLRDGDSCGG